jgi:hypothetical protein
MMSSYVVKPGEMDSLGRVASATIVRMTTLARWRLRQRKASSRDLPSAIRLAI